MKTKLWPVIVLCGSLFGWFGQVCGQGSPTPAPAVPATQASGSFRMSGTVVDGMSGQRLSGAQVTIGASGIPDSTRMAASDEEGGFTFENLAPGKYVLSARRRGYVPQMYQQHELFSTAVVVGAGLNSENLRFELRPGASISGDVTDEAGDAVRGATVTLLRQNIFNGIKRTHSMRQVQTNDEGHYRFWHLMPGTYFVSVSAQPWYAQHNVRQQPRVESGSDGEGQPQPILEQNRTLDVTYPMTFFSNAKDMAGAAALTLHPGDAEIADFALRAVPALHLLVKTPPTGDGQQLAFVSATQMVTEGNPISVSAGSMTVGPGLVEVTGLPPGKVNLDLYGNAQKPSERTHRSQTVQLSGDTEIDMAESGSGVVVSGVMRVDDGSAVPQPARVRLENAATGEMFDTDVAANGEFSFKNSPVGTGSYELMIIQGQGLYVKSLSSPNVKTVGRSFQIASAQDVSVTILASKGNGKINGVALRDGKPAEGVMIVLAPEDLHGNPALFRRDQSDSDGSFTLSNVVSGRYTLMALENGWDLEWGNADVLQKYVAGGEKVELPGSGKTEIKVKVQ